MTIVYQLLKIATWNGIRAAKGNSYGGGVSLVVQENLLNCDKWAWNDNIVERLQVMQWKGKLGALLTLIFI